MQNQSGSQEDGFSTAKDEIASRLQSEKASATEALHDARDQVTAKATEYAQDAKETLLKQADGTQRDISSNLAAFGGALRAASEHLANSEQKTASKFVLDAAGGLESLSGSLKNRPFEEVLGDLRSFGNKNAGAMIAGSVLAGLALGRFLKSSGESATSAGQSEVKQTGNGSDFMNAKPVTPSDAPGTDVSSGSSFGTPIDEPANDWPSEPAR